MHHKQLDRNTIMCSVNRQAVKHEHTCSYYYHSLSLSLSLSPDSSKDYVQLKQDLIFELGEKHKTVKVYMINDGSVEERETFKLLIEPHNILSPSDEATVDIIDDDSKYKHTIRAY